MLRLILPSVSCSTRTMTSWSCSSTSCGSSTGSSAIWEMCTMPSTGVPSAPGGVTSMKAPKSEKDLTLPGSHVSALTSLNCRSISSRLLAGAPTSFIVRLSLPASTSTARTRTFTSSPGFTTVVMSSMKSVPGNCVMGTSPCALPRPPFGCGNATKAPDFAVPTTLPSSHFSESTSWNSSRGQLTSLMVTDIRCAWTSTFSTRTWIFCPSVR
mmetsp:Transcript_54678/g.152620  ORF Transcript_54678/g.152620 Transcript_54678/m.152620 type:complete len:212 (-) Transcript_54678:802-1437(-)